MFYLKNKNEAAKHIRNTLEHSMVALQRYTKTLNTNTNDVEGQYFNR